MPVPRCRPKNRKTPFFIFSCCVVVLLLGGTARAAGRRPPELKIEADPATVMTGRTLLVRFKAPARLRTPRLSIGGRSADFYSVSTGTWRALWGISLKETPGPKEARVEALWGKKIVVSTFSFSVEIGTYPVSRVTLTHAQRDLFASGQVALDTRVLTDVCQRPPIGKKLWSGLFVLPTTGTFTSVFGSRRAYGNGPVGGGHSGTDIANPAGTPIFAPARGRVAFSRLLESFGNVVVVEHGQGVFTYYLHMEKALAKEGDMLATGDPVGLMGSLGISTGPHLHWSMVVSGERVDAMEWTERVFE
jgi:murein DD-endopeptidase MepM/ murein hydrolase activator NlpD